MTPDHARKEAASFLQALLEKYEVPDVRAVYIALAVASEAPGIGRAACGLIEAWRSSDEGRPAEAMEAEVRGAIRAALRELR